MRIIVKSGSHTDVNLAIPTNLIFNRVSILLLMHICKKQERVRERQRQRDRDR